MEQWKLVKLSELKGIYEVSNYGRVRSIPRVIHDSIGRTRNVPEKYLYSYITDKGYCKVRLTKKDGGARNYLVHRLVGFSFIENPFGYPEINHKNGDKRNNNYKNLEWVTRGMNVRHAIETGLLDPYAISTSKAVYSLDRDGNILDRHESIEEASRVTGCKVKKVSDVLNGRRKSTGGYEFKFV